MNQNNSPMLKLGALWKSKNGSENLSGTINNDLRIVVIPNRYKTEDRHPDFVVMLAQNEKKDGPRKPVSPDSINPEDIGF